MKVSVVIPVFNGKKFLAGCLDAMMRQTCRDLEIIVVDDASTDGSTDIARSYPGVRVISFERNRGPSAARNAGIEAASGEWIHFMDVDDMINNRFYELMAAAAVAADADIACSGMIHESKPHRTTIYHEQRVLTTTDEKFRVTRAGVWGYVWRYLFRMSMLRDRGLGFEEGRLIEDLPFVVAAIYFSNRMVLVPGAEYTYVRQPGSLMQNRDREHRRRRHRDHRHAKELRHNFARLHGFHIAGVPTWAGPLSLFYVKWFT
jgi:glycosyltransferase involved in cell wall biosynthesis